jgi:hypothetical protein
LSALPFLLPLKKLGVGDALTFSQQTLEGRQHRTEKRFGAVGCGMKRVD